MKKLYLLLFIGFGLSGFGQTYTATFIFPDELICQSELDLVEFYCTPLQEYSWSIKSDNSLLFYRSGVMKTIVFPNLPVKNNCEAQINYFCSGMDLIYSTCTPSSRFTTDNIITAIKNGFVEGASSLNWVQNIYMAEFKPNGIFIKELDNNLICSGQQLDLQCFPDGFPNEIYHWQYSSDNQATWKDVPENFNDAKISNFTIYDILGEEHVNHYGAIDFRIGYADRPFSTNIITINYSPCAPEIYSVNAPNPTCYESPIPDVTITFKRDLIDGEILKHLSIVKSSDETSILYQYPIDIDHFEGTTPYKTFTLSNLPRLEKSDTYKIKYQAYLGTINRGYMYSENFTYIAQKPLKYTISPPTLPTCFGGDDGSIEIQVTSGANPYHFYQDAAEVTPTIENGMYYLRGLSAKSDGYKIIVTDTNGCIEK